jgi:hypothetical protein
MLTTLFYCLTFAWDPAPGPVHHYSVFVDSEVIIESVVEARSDVCFNDITPHYVSVQAFTEDGAPGPMSDGSEEVRMIVEPPFYLREVDPRVAADLDRDGVVGYADFGVFTQVWGSCNDGGVYGPCP